MKRYQKGMSIPGLLAAIVSVLALSLVIVGPRYSAQQRDQVLQERWAPRLAATTSPQQRALVEAIQVEVAACSIQEDPKRAAPAFKSGWLERIETREGPCFDLLSARLTLNADPDSARALISQLQAIQ